jgi:hypothetical protein
MFSEIVLQIFLHRNADLLGIYKPIPVRIFSDISLRGSSCRPLYALNGDGHRLLCEL